MTALADQQAYFDRPFTLRMERNDILQNAYDAEPIDGLGMNPLEALAELTALSTKESR